MLSMTLLTDTRAIEKLRAYIEAGFSIIPLRPRSKSPVENDWTDRPNYTFKQLKVRAEPNSNFGVRLGRPSKVDGRYLHVLDVDIRKPEYEDEALDALEELLPDVEWWTFPQVKSGSGGKSFHVYFLSKTAFKSKKLAKSNEKFVDSDGKSHYCWEIEQFGTGKQVVVPPSVHPETGNPYKWLKKPDFHAGLPEIDDELLAELSSDDGHDDAERDVPIEITDLEMDEVLDILDELQDWANDRETWLRVGMALKLLLGDKKGWPVFDKWSRGGDGYDRNRNWIDWKSFKNSHKNPITLRTLIREYRDRMRMADFEELDAEDEEVVTKPVSDRKREHKDDIPDDLLRVPGALQHVVDFYNRNSMVDQPEFAVMSALAFGSVIAGRNTVTNLRNYSSVYFLGIGGSGSGKESVRTCVNHLLHECGFGKMAGPQYMTSEGALITYLLDSPKLLLTPDELGKRMKEDRGGGNPYAEGVYRAYMSIFGSLHTEWKPSGYSGRGKSKEEVNNILNLKITRPALTMVGMTTPSTFYETIAQADVASGFLARFVIVQGKPEIQTQRIIIPKDSVDEDLIDWAKHVSMLCGNSDDEMLLRVDQAAEVAPLVVPFTDSALEYIHEIEEERAERMREIEHRGLAEIFNRTREITQRLSLIVALSEDYTKIHTKHVRWAWRYVKHYADKTVESFLQNLGRGNLHQIADQIADRIEDAAEKGMTSREIIRNFHSFSSLATRDSDEVLRLLKRDYGIDEVKIHTKGRSRLAFVSPKHRKKKETDDE